MIRKITGIFLALLLVNPFCCCLGGDGGQNGAPVDSAKEQHSCCASTSANTEHSESSNSSDSDPAPCHCDSRDHTMGLPEEFSAVKITWTCLDQEKLVPRYLPDGPWANLLLDLEHSLEASVATEELPLPTHASAGRTHALVHGVFLI